MGQCPSGQRTDDAVDDQGPASGVEVSCLEILDRLTNFSIEFQIRIECFQESSAGQQSDQIGDCRASVTA